MGIRAQAASRPNAPAEALKPLKF
ncbi:hypothetical protein [Belnapia moabensis]